MDTQRSSMEQSLLRYKQRNGHAAMRALIERVAGVVAISEIPDDKIGDVIAACAETLDELAPSAYARWNASKPRGRLPERRR